jgi:hypothetical protein
MPPGKGSGIAALILGPPKKKEGEEEMSEAKMAAEEFLEAVKAGDADRLIEAFKSLDLATSNAEEEE